jgi:exonuclease SbcD
MKALKTYLDNREDLKDIQADLLEAAQRLLAKEETAWLDSDGDEEALESGTHRQSQLPVGNMDGQLRLL